MADNPFTNASQDFLDLNPGLGVHQESQNHFAHTGKKVAQGSSTSENDWQRVVIDYAHLRGWHVAHFRGAWSKDGERYMTPVGADGKGFPDLCLVRERVVFAELKSETGKLSREQADWYNKLKAAEQEVSIWRPSDWNKIVKILE